MSDDELDMALALSASSQTPPHDDSRLLGVIGVEFEETVALAMAMSISDSPQLKCEERPTGFSPRSDEAIARALAEADSSAPTLPGGWTTFTTKASPRHNPAPSTPPPPPLTPEKHECSICLVEIEAGGDILALPCIHVFHRECVVTWLARSKTCPICKTAADIEYDLPPSPSFGAAEVVTQEDQDAAAALLRSMRWITGTPESQGPPSSSGFWV